VTEGPADRRGDIGPQWIKAHVIGGVIYVAVTFVAYVAGWILGVNEPRASIALQTGFVVLATAALASGLLVLGYLAGVVLRTTLPAFPMTGWLALYAVSGVLVGAISALAWLTPETPPDLDPVDVDIVVGLAMGAAVVGAAGGAMFGSLQALILRSVAQGLGLWIACSSLAGALFVLIVPAIVYGPQSGFGSEVAIEGVTLVVTIVAAIILLPAVRRLRQR
jgi:hypothetical protein